MRYVEKFLRNFSYSFLEVSVYDEEDIRELETHKTEENVLISVADLKYLTLFSKIKRLIITAGQIEGNVSARLKELVCLQELSIDYEETEPATSWCLDISVIPNLVFLFSRTSYNFCNVSECKSLKTLIVMRWYEDDLSKLRDSALDSLEICSGRLKSIDGLGETPLKILSLANLRGLKDIFALEKLPLKIFELENCNNVCALDCLVSKSVEYLMIYGKNKVQSGRFVLNFEKLKRLVLDISIEDGDLSKFDELEHVSLLSDRKHFNRKHRNLPKATTEYKIADIPDWRYIYSNRSI